MHHLVDGVDGGQLTEHGHSKHLGHQVGPQEVSEGLVHLEVSRTHPDLGNQPVVRTVAGQEDGGRLAGNLTQLGRANMKGGKRNNKIEILDDVTILLFSQRTLYLDAYSHSGACSD